MTDLERYFTALLDGKIPACRRMKQAAERLLEALACQNQLLVELLGAVNALTAATLSIQSRL